MKLRHITGDCSRIWIETLHQRNFESIHGEKRMRIGWKYLEKGRTGGGIGHTGSWGVESTQELQDSMKESRSHHQGVQGALHRQFLREGKK
jgi:hypothetical protein